MSLIGLRVLVVEDEPVLAMLVEEYLEDLGCKVVAIATRLNDALKQARTLDLDAGVLDVNLAGELSYPSGRSAKGPNCPLLVCDGLWIRRETNQYV